MRLQPELIIATLLFACSAPKANESSTTNIIGTDDPNPGPAPLENDSVSYVGYIYKFDDNGLFYTDLYFVDDFNYDLYDQVKNTGDSIVYEGEETKRIMIPVNKTGKYFNLTGMARINIYSRENRLVTTGSLKQIEYVEDVIEGKFVAVFEAENPSVPDYAFCIGNSNSEPSTIQYTVIEDEQLKSTLIGHLQLDSNRIWNITHYKIEGSETTYSTLSADTSAFIVETVGDVTETLYKSSSSETIGELTIISKEINGRPLLLIACGLPESDITWTSLLVFDGTAYQPARHHRLRRL